VKLGKRTAKLLREAIVLAHVEGARWGQCHDRDAEYPADSDVVFRVLSAAAVLNDIYPTLSKLEEAQAADQERRQRFTDAIVAELQGEGEK
jgi:hypothetical protein